MSIVAKDQIHGWKEIAAYLNRDERTAKRWEKQRGLPVRRIPGGGRANVYVLVADLESWLSNGSAQSRASSVAPDSRASAEDPSSAEFSAIPESPLLEVPATTGFPRRWFVPLSLFALAFFALGAYLIHLRHQPRPAPSLARNRAVYKSPKPGVDDLYLQGAYFLEERTPQSLEAARKAFVATLAIDSSDAPAYAGLANTYLMMREFATLPSEEAYQRARAAAEHALLLDPNLPEAHASLGFIDFFSAWQAESAASHFQTALRLDPQCLLALHWYGSMLTHQGRLPEALDLLNQARHLQPSSSAILASEAFAIGLSGRRDEATRTLQSILRTDPNMPAPHRILAHLSLMAPRNLPLYLDELQKFAEIRKDSGEAETVRRARTALAHNGERAMWQAILDRERETRPLANHPTYPLAQAEVQLGLTARALDDLETLYRQRESLLMNLRTDSLFDPIRSDPRLQAIESRIGLIPQPQPSR